MHDRHSISSSFSVPYGYRVFFTHGVFEPANPLLAEILADLAPGDGPLSCLAVVDAGLAAATPTIVDDITRCAQAYADKIDVRLPPTILPGGEAAKEGLETTLDTVRLGVRAGLCRQGLVMAVGGGAFLDAVGLGAALLHRGVRLLRLPSTVLAQNDSGVGVKNAVNMCGSKNLIGTFAPPAAVVNDLRFLLTLADADWISGIAEAFKVGIIRDRGFLDWLADHAEALRTRDMAAMEILIRRCAELHCSHIATGGDPFETGSARPLDFGHWAAHKLEALSEFGLKHGNAVAVGIALDLLYAAKRGFIARADAEWPIRAMVRCGLPVWDPHLAARGPEGEPLVFTGIEEFRQHLGGTLHVTFPAPLGHRHEATCIDRAAMADALSDLDRINHRILGEMST